VARSVGNYGVLADLYEAFGDELEALDFELHERMRMAQSLATRGHFPAALFLYAQIFDEHAGYMPAVKELIQLSDNCLRQDSLLETALEIYNLLDRSCPGHPFEEYTEQGREEAQRRLARAH
jgi:hypothetical protein